jgi:zinc protease
MSAITEYTLDNGLKIILKEVHTAPVVSWWVLYRVGSRHEPTGQTGISHWVEHMMFKGTALYPAGVLDKQIDREGGSWNAHTSLDHTAYYETLPADRIDLALDIEADRMTHANFDPAEVESERTVIISERQGSENSPGFWLNEEVQAAAFRVHPYHHVVIGDMADLQTLTRDDLYNHYRRYYMPNNAIAVAVGAFNTDDLLEQIQARYGEIPVGPAPRQFIRTEPEQNGERRVYVERPGQTAYIQVAYRVPPATHPDWIKFSALDSILGGPSGPGGGQIGNKTSRLYRALVETELTLGVSASLSLTVDPYLYRINLTLRDGRTHAEVENALLEQIDRLQNELVSEAELTKAKKQARAAYAFSTERVSGQAFWLAHSENIRSYRWFETYADDLQAITAEDIQDVAQKYLVRTQRTVGWFIPTTPPSPNGT